MNRIPAVVAVGLLWSATTHANPEITVDLPGAVTMEFVWVEPGTFMMGSPYSEVPRLVNEGPQHQVTITQGFWLGKYELTQGQWLAVMGTAPWSGEDDVRASANNPAVDISWDDMQGLVRALNQAAGDAVYRLPTEAEWEYACRAGTTTRWSFGDSESQLGYYSWDRHTGSAGLAYAQPVGTMRPNPWGLYDMHGNVWEWVNDWYGEYGSAAQVDPPGPATGSSRVVRGGDQDGPFPPALYTRSATRLGADRVSGIGARLLMMGPAPTDVAPQGWGQIKSGDCANTQPQAVRPAPGHPRR